MGGPLGQFLKFGVVGGLATLIDFGGLILLAEVAHMDPLLAGACSFSVSVAFNYAASMRYVFSHRADLSRQREFAVFVVLSVVGLGLNEGLLYLGTYVAGAHYALAKAVATAMVMLWNFWSRKRWLDGGTPAETAVEKG